MGFYQLIVLVHWLFFTLSIHLVNGASVVVRPSNDISSVPALATAHTMPPTTPASATATLPTTFVTSTATLRPAKLSICETDVEHFISDHGKESSISLDLEPHRMVSHRGPCRVTLTAPEPFGFVVKLVRTKTKLQRNLATTTLVPASSPVTAPLYSTRAAIGSRGGRTANASIGATENRTTSCPLKIFSGNDPLAPPWVLDPCQLDGRPHRELVRLMEGHLRVLWQPSADPTRYTLIVTTLGKGYQCEASNMHPCLKIGQETLFCVSSSLVCDNINHCPPGELYNSDEDPEMCARRHSLLDRNKSYGLNLWQRITEEFMSKFYSPLADVKPTKTTDDDLSAAHDGQLTDDDDANDENAVEATTIRNGQRKPMRGLSKYGPWGYLILGMLLCGGTLLLCVLWECCCRSNKDPLVPTLDGANISTIAGNGHSYMNQIESTMPPNYDELDPPPSYSALFPAKFETATASVSTTTIASQAPSTPITPDISLPGSSLTTTSMSSLPSSTEDCRSILTTPSASILSN